MITSLNKNTMKYFEKEALEQFGKVIGKTRIELSADFVMEAIGKKVEFTTNDKGRRFASIQVQLEDGDLTNCPVKYERKLAEAISEITIAQVAAKQAEFEKDPLIGKTSESPSRSTETGITRAPTAGRSSRSTFEGLDFVVHTFEQRRCVPKKAVAAGSERSAKCRKC